MDAQKLFNQVMPKELENNPQKSDDVNAIFLFKVSGDKGGVWTIDLKNNPPQIIQGDQGNADCTVEMSDEDFEKAFESTANAMMLMFSGKIKVSGDPMLATKLQEVFKG